MTRPLTIAPPVLDVAVLARVNSVLLGPQIELRRRGIPVVNAVRASWLQQRAGVEIPHSRKRPLRVVVLVILDPELDRLDGVIE